MPSCSVFACSGDPLLFEFNATGTQRLILQPSYYLLGHLSRFARPGASVVVSGGAGIATSNADYEAIRAYGVSAGTAPVSGLKLVAAAFISADETHVIVVVGNPNDGPDVPFKLADGTGRAVQTSIPPKAVQTYTWAL